MPAPPDRRLPIDPDVVDSDVAEGESQAGRPGAPLGAVVRTRWDILVVIAAGGALGAAARFGFGELLPHERRDLPWSTFLVNVSGCFGLGFLMVFLVAVWSSSRYLRPFLGVGFLGGYTTFSTYALEARDLIAQRPELAGLYLFGSVFAGLAAVWLGIVAAQGALAAAYRLRALRNETR